MRIAVFTDNFYPELGGIQDSIAATASELGRRGHRLMIVAPSASRRDYARLGRAPAELDLGPNVQIRRIAAVHVPSSSQQSRLAMPTGRRWRELGDFRPELVHSHTFLGAGLEAVRAARRLGVPLVGTNHWSVGAFDVYVPFGRRVFRHVSSRLVARYYQNCAWVSAPLRFTIDDMRANGLRAQARVISNPIDTTLFRPVSPSVKRSLKARLNLGSEVIVYAGRLGREKRIDVLIRALAEVHKQLPHVSLVVAGHGSDRAKLEKLAQELGVGRSVQFRGTLDHRGLADLFAAADLFAIASTSETQSMVLLQAMASGLPVVGARSGGLVEHVPATVGRLAEPQDPASFSNAMASMLSDSRSRDVASRAARTFAEGFSISSVVDAWEDLYGRVISGDSGIEASTTVNSEKVIERTTTCA